ncbi:MAG: tetratricopeptide repeat protein [Pedosphaera sp.]|jgi:tetratricopeptide (TPR) repeat protein|nr:tetratricopeptide repeat protein [Pedosphaera sp.]
MSALENEQMKQFLIFCRFTASLGLALAMLACLPGCEPKTPRVVPPPANTNQNPSALANPNANGLDACNLILLPVAGDTPTDQKIAQTQKAVREGGAGLNHSIEQLGWLFVSKARVTFDPGFYKLAEQCALCLEDKSPHNPAALSLRGNVLHSLHRFKEAEPLARELVAQRGLSYDYGLLGDLLMEMGHLDEAIEAYQHMIDLRPDLYSYTRVAHVRWLKGDLKGAVEALQLALQSTTPLDPETAAWVYSRMAQYQLQAGNFEFGLQHTAAALQYQPKYAPALLAQGRLLLAEGHEAQAVEPLRRAATLNPVPEYQWLLVEALRATGQSDTALEKELQEHGAASDPRTYALYLANENKDPVTAIRLAQEELKTREDVFTHDALAWALASAGHYAEAADQMDQALSQGTQDARLFYHAGIIEENQGKYRDALQSFIEADGLRQMLLPSERAQVGDHLLALGLSGTDWEAQSPDANPDRIARANTKTGFSTQ